MLCAIWYHFYNLKNVKNTHGGVIIKLKAKDCNLLKLSILHECFSHSSNCTNGTKLRKASHVAERNLYWSDLLENPCASNIWSCANGKIPLPNRVYSNW